MLQLRTCIALSSLRQPFRKALTTAARLGADAIEIDARHQVPPREMTQTGIRDIKHQLENYGLRVASVSYRTRRGYNVEQELDERVAGTKEAMSLARKLGASAVVNHIGVVPDSEKDRLWSLMVDTLRDLGQYSQHVGAMLAARTGSEDGALLARLLDAVGGAAIGIAFDPGALIMNGFSASEAIRCLSSRVLHVSATDAARDLSSGRGMQMRLGEGAVDYPDVLSVLEQANYLGYFCVEPAGGPAVADDLAAGIQYLRSF